VSEDSHITPHWTMAVMAPRLRASDERRAHTIVKSGSDSLRLSDSLRAGRAPLSPSPPPLPTPRAWGVGQCSLASAARTRDSEPALGWLPEPCTALHRDGCPMPPGCASRAHRPRRESERDCRVRAGSASACCPPILAAALSLSSVRPPAPQCVRLGPQPRRRPRTCRARAERAGPAFRSNPAFRFSILGSLTRRALVRAAGWLPRAFGSGSASSSSRPRSCSVRSST
jgi:hypothetical protein